MRAVSRIFADGAKLSQMLASLSRIDGDLAVVRRQALHSIGGGCCRPEADLTGIAFNRPGVPWRGFVGVAAKLAFRAPLAQQIPTLVELHFKLSEPSRVVVWLAGVRTQMVLFFDKLRNVVEYGLVVHLLLRN